MASRDAWIKARSLLRMVYGKLANDDVLRSLHATCDDLDDETLVAAIGRHVDNSEQSGSSLAGEWCPKPAQIRFHANALQVEAENLRRQTLDLAAEKIRKEALTETTTVEFPAGSALGLPSELTLTSTACSECRDSGFAFYYCPSDRAHPANKYNLFLQDEYNELPDEMRRAYERFPAVCDCQAGQIRRSQSPNAHTTGVDCNGRPRRLYITIEEARRMSANRQAKDQQRIGAVSQ